MKITKFEVRERKISKLNQVTYAGESNVDTFHFDFDDEWKELEKTLVIIVDGTTYNVALLNDEVVLPIEAYVDNKSITIGVFGRNGDTVLSSTLKDIWMTKGAYEIGKEPSNLPTPTQWDLYVAEINRLLNESKLTKEECERILAELKEFANQSILEINTLKEQVNQTVQEFNDNVEEKTIAFDKNSEEKLKNYNSVAEEKENNLNAIAEDVRDMASALTFATFDVEPTEGALYVNSAESLGNMGFSVENDGAMYVEIPKKEVS